MTPFWMVAHMNAVGRLPRDHPAIAGPRDRGVQRPPRLRVLTEEERLRVERRAVVRDARGEKLIVARLDDEILRAVPRRARASRRTPARQCCRSTWRRRMRATSCGRTPRSPGCPTTRRAGVAPLLPRIGCEWRARETETNSGSLDVASFAIATLISGAGQIAGCVKTASVVCALDAATTGVSTLGGELDRDCSPGCVSVPSAWRLSVAMPLSGVRRVRCTRSDARRRRGGCAARASAAPTSRAPDAAGPSPLALTTVARTSVRVVHTTSSPPSRGRRDEGDVGLRRVDRIRSHVAVRGDAIREDAVESRRGRGESVAVGDDVERVGVVVDRQIEPHDLTRPRDEHALGAVQDADRMPQRREETLAVPRDAQMRCVAAARASSCA